MNQFLRLRVLGILAFFVFGMSRSPSSLAQSVDPATGLVLVPSVPSAEPRAFGTSEQTLYQVPAFSCSPVSSTTVNASANGYFFTTSGIGYVDCPLNLPAGAKIDTYQVVVYDRSDTADVSAAFVVCPTISVTNPCLAFGSMASSGTSGSPFNGYLTKDLSGIGLVVNKAAALYFVQVTMHQTDASTRFRQVNVFYHLQISPAPAVATFGDVPTTHTYFRAIEALAASGITQGCGNGNFCPNQNVTRGEMAAFFARALGLHFPD